MKMATGWKMYKKYK